MNEEVNVLMLVPNLRVSNGVASFAMNYYRKLDHSKVHMDFVSYKKIDSSYIAEIEGNGDHVYYVSAMKKTYKHVIDCKRIIRNKKYDIIHDNSLLVTFPIMYMAKKRIPIRILHSHSTKIGENSKRERRNILFMPLLKGTANCFAACSIEAGKALFRDALFDVVPDVINVCQYKFDEEVRKKIRKQENCNEKYIIGTVGRITEAKNPFFAIDVMEAVLQRNSDIEYWWIGSGALDKELAKYIENRKLNDRIRLFGSRNDVKDLLQAIDLFFMPSKFEGFGMACVEAQASGLQCIVSDVLSKELNITGNVTYIPLDNDVLKWAEIIEEKKEMKVDRLQVFEKVLLCDYSDSNAGIRLTDYYKKLLIR